MIKTIYALLLIVFISFVLTGPNEYGGTCDRSSRQIVEGVGVWLIGCGHPPTPSHNELRREYSGG